MSGKFKLSRKMKLTAHGQHNVFTLGAREREVHVLMKSRSQMTVRLSTEIKLDEKSRFRSFKEH